MVQYLGRCCYRADTDYMHNSTFLPALQASASGCTYAVQVSTRQYAVHAAPVIDGADCLADVSDVTGGLKFGDFDQFGVTDLSRVSSV